ncbi:MAG: transcription termination/antitermination NusG family protein [Candidatus Promineifilaceae bacterium]|nr:transcription termination/antitermination NusG family protein [Candidatus Promineifilaceae bacterium]
MSLSWYALHTKPHKERSVAERLRAQGIEVYYPNLRVTPVNPRARKQRPYFPGYLFVRLDLEEMGENALRWTPGCHGLVSFGGEPASVPDNLIAILEKRVREYVQSDSEQRRDFEPGDRVRVTTGPFEGYEAIFEGRLSGRQRVQVLLSLLRRRPKRLQLDADQLDQLYRHS